MVQRRLTHATLAIAASTAAMALCAPPAGAKESKRSVCTPALSSYKSALQSEKSGHLREARDLYQSCAEATVCGGLAPKCKAAVDRIGTQMPSVVPIVTDAAGAPRLDVQVTVDGQTFASHLDGKALPVETGAHEFTFATDGRVFATKKILIAEGERNRKIEISMQPADTGSSRPAPVAARAAPAAPNQAAAEGPTDKPEHEDQAASVAISPEERSRGGPWAMPTSPLPYIVGGVGLLGVGAGGLLTYWGNKDNDQAVAQCRHTCSQSTADHIRNLYIASDVSFGVGLVGLGLATWMFARSHSAEEARQPKAAYVFDVAPVRSGALAAVKGSF